MLRLNKPKMWRKSQTMSHEYSSKSNATGSITIITNLFLVVIALAWALVTYYSSTFYPIETSMPFEGFWAGLVHGAGIVLSLIIKLQFNHEVSIYVGTGTAYQVGFVLGIVTFGVGSRSRRSS